MLYVDFDILAFHLSIVFGPYLLSIIIEISDVLTQHQIFSEAYRIDRRYMTKEKEV